MWSNSRQMLKITLLNILKELKRDKKARKSKTLSARNYNYYGICTENGGVFE